MNNDLSTKYQRFSELASPPLPVKYQRTFGCRPSAEENPLNAWYVIHLHDHQSYIHLFPPVMKCLN